MLRFELERFDVRAVSSKVEPGLYFLGVLHFNIRNVGRTAAKEWGLFARRLSHPVDGFLITPGRRFDFAEFPFQGSWNSSIPLSQTILPGADRVEEKRFGFQIVPDDRAPWAVEQAIRDAFERTEFIFQLATEDSPGEPTALNLLPAIDTAHLARLAVQDCPDFFE